VIVILYQYFILITASDIQFQLAAVRQLLGCGAEITWHRRSIITITGTVAVHNNFLLLLLL